MKSSILDAIRDGVILGDGAMGTVLYERGLVQVGCCEDLNRTSPDVIQGIHAEYVKAGSQVIETNTFAANRVKLSRHQLGDSVQEINEAGVKLAKAAARDQVWVAGSVGPLGMTPEEASGDYDPKQIFEEQISTLWSAGIDILFLETFSDLDEILLALKISKKWKPDGPVLCSLSFTEDGITHKGTEVNHAFDCLQKAGATIVGANCSVGPTALVNLYTRRVLQKSGLIYSAFPNSGRPQMVDGRYYYGAEPRYFAERSLELAKAGVKLLGGCCGTRPDHIAELAQLLKEAAGKKGVISVEKPRVEISTADKPAYKPEKADEPTLLDIIKKRTLIVTEFDSPKSLLLDKMMEAARALKKAGTDFITVADNSLAIMRMNCVVASHLVERETGLRPIVHLACRDRNLIGTQSELMGMDALGLDHVLALTGDPAKVGDSPGAASVYDLNSISLLEGIRSMNEGRSFTGRDLKRATRFVSGCSFNPNVKNLEIQVKRLERKVAAGAKYAMTQPIFDVKQVKQIVEATAKFNIPILVGVLPLLNARNTEFLHNEVPGIVIPDTVRERMRGKEGTDGAKAGLEIASDIAKEVLAHFKGIYLITPLVRYEATAVLSQKIRENLL